MRRRHFIQLSPAAIVAVAAPAMPAIARGQFFRIGTGGPGGTYFPIGGLLASAISEASGGGVKGMVASAVATQGALANVHAIAAGQLEAALAQADIAYWAWSGTGLFDGRPRLDSLRLIANLYAETIHIVVRRGAGIASVADLRGRRVSLDEPGSGTLVDARIVLEAHGLTERDLRAEYLKAGPAADLMRDGELDAFFIVGGAPIGAIAELATSIGDVALLPIEGPPAARLLEHYRFFSPGTIAAGTYQGVDAVQTLAVGAQLIVPARLPDDLVYAVTVALWNANTRRLLDAGHPKGKLIRPETALLGAAIPLHPGAERFYRETGALN